jgi:hypothetical protein
VQHYANHARFAVVEAPFLDRQNQNTTQKPGGNSGLFYFSSKNMLALMPP